MENTAKRGAALLEVIRALIIGLILSLALVLLAAFIIKLFNLPSSLICPSNAGLTVLQNLTPDKEVCSCHHFSS